MTSDEATEHGWEDVRDPLEGSKIVKTSEAPEESSISSKSIPNTPRRRRPGTRTTYIATSSFNPRKTTMLSRPKSATARQSSTQPLVSEDELHAAFNVGVRSSFKYIHEVVTWFFYLLKRPLSLILVLWAVAFTLNSLSASLRAAFYPLCIIPGISRSPLCTRSIATGENAGHPQHAEYPKMVEIQSKTFEQLLDESVGGSTLALEIKKAEMATADLVAVVRTSDLKSKDILADSLGAFVNNARDTARGLQKLNAKVSGSVDNILAISDYALHEIEGTENKQSSLMKYVWPFNYRPDLELLSSTFSQSLSVLSTSLENLILSAEASLQSLDKLEAQLGTIHDILTREDVSLTAEQSELLAALWSRLGGNRARKHRFEGNLQLLRHLGGYRSRALAHVVAALQALQTLSADMEELRERAASPELSGGEIPMRVHAQAIRSGVHRLNEGRLKAKEKEEEALQRVLGLDSVLRYVDRRGTNIPKAESSTRAVKSRGRTRQTRLYIAAMDLNTQHTATSQFIQADDDDDFDDEALPSFSGPTMEDDHISPIDKGKQRAQEQLAPPGSVNDAAVLSGNIGSAASGSGAPPGQSRKFVGGVQVETRYSGVDTLDEPVTTTIARDLRSIYIKVVQVLYPSRSGVGREVLRDWDLWGPLILCLLLGIMLSANSPPEQALGVFTAVVVIVCLGSVVVTIQAKLLGGRVSFFQALCVLGYCVAPLDVAALIACFVRIMWVRIPVALGAWAWCIWAHLSTRIASVNFLDGTKVEQQRILLAVYPLLVFTAAWRRTRGSRDPALYSEETVPRAAILSCAVFVVFRQSSYFSAARAKRQLVLQQDINIDLNSSLDSNLGSVNADTDSVRPHERRIVAVGDLHGDFGNALKVLQMAGVVDTAGDWTGDVELFVQTGDIIDRGKDTIKLFLWMEKLRSQARNVGGDVISHLGNHEWMNLLGDWRYVYPDEIDTFGSIAARQKMFQTGRIGRAWAANYSITSRIPLHPPMGHTSPFPTAQFYASDAQSLDFDPNSPEANAPLARAALSFVHGGLAPNYAHLTPYPAHINALGRTLLERLQTRPFPPPHPPAPYAGLPADATPEERSLYMDDGPLWYRGWALRPEAEVCGEVDEVLERTGVRRLIMGHTPDFNKITPRCGGKIIIIDTGISHAYGGVLSALSVKYTLMPHQDNKRRWTEREVVTALYPDHQDVLIIEEQELMSEL
ncbi:hypothetical protein EW145_g4488 [Phellinidium pouzarii]|uniref:Calcineurin-like phosphoesterase domain-containing protein n=1 Tax=Phellinidium pouzarii TaxID=167371 RepID=A0A4S4L877_9AGAM|nr:hypothetical protein EW145_g4488 [Phellinidium pouzarii]